MTEDEMVGWHHQLNGHEFEQSLGGSEGQSSLVCCCPQGHNESDMTMTEQQLCRASLIAQLVKNLPAMQETLVQFLGRDNPGEGIGYPLQYSWVSLVAQLVKNPPAMRETWV